MKTVKNDSCANDVALASLLAVSLLLALPSQSYQGAMTRSRLLVISASPLYLGKISPSFIDMLNAYNASRGSALSFSRFIGAAMELGQLSIAMNMFINVYALSMSSAPTLRDAMAIDALAGNNLLTRHDD
jgi:hypothetical protein